MERRKFLSWKGLPKRVANLFIDRFTTNAQNRAPNHFTNDSSHNNQHSTIWLNIPLVGDLTIQLVKKLKCKLHRCLIDPNVDIQIKEKTTKLCFFTSTKNKTPPLSQSNVVYEFTCPGCNSSYIGKTNRTLLVRTQEHALMDIYKHFCYCDQFKHIHGLYNLPDVFINENHPPSTAMNEEYLSTIYLHCTLLSPFQVQNSLELQSIVFMLLAKANTLVSSANILKLNLSEQLGKSLI